jgi:hypothetical protein
MKVGAFLCELGGSSERLIDSRDCGLWVCNIHDEPSVFAATQVDRDG